MKNTERFTFFSGSKGQLKLNSNGVGLRSYSVLILRGKFYGTLIDMSVLVHQINKLIVKSVIF